VTGHVALGVVRAGRIEIFGKHTDYAGGRSLVAAVPRGFAVVAPRADGRVRAIDARWRDATEVNPADEDTLHRWANYVGRRAPVGSPF
jgi:galactokinase